MQKKKPSKEISNNNQIIVPLTKKQKILFVLEKAIRYQSDFKIYIKDNNYIFKLGDRE